MKQAVHIYIFALMLVALTSISLMSANAMDLAEARELTTTCKSSAETLGFQVFRRHIGVFIKAVS